MKMIPALGALVLLTLVLASPLASGDWSVPTGGTAPAVVLPPAPGPGDASQLDYAAALADAGARLAHVRAQEPQLDALVMALALEPRAAFDFVRQRLRTEQYVGHLRDPEAVLAAGAGNAYDKTLTLAALLARMGFHTRVVSAEIPAGLTAPGAASAACADAGGHDPAVWRIAALGAEAMERVRLRAGASYRALHPRLAVPPDAGETAPPPARRHYWLQVREGADWVDLDAAERTASWGNPPLSPGTPLDEPAQTHSVTLALELEVLGDGGLQRREILRETFDVPEYSGVPLALVFGPQNEGIGGALAQALAEVQGDTGKMKATLLIGDDLIHSSAFPIPAAAPSEAGFLGPASGVRTTALRLHLSATAPGLAEARESRTLIDLIPDARRVAADAGAPITPADLRPPTPGERVPAALEGVRTLVISNGGLSRTRAAAQALGNLLDLPETLARAASGAPDPETLLWLLGVQAGAVALAGEELIRARPAHGGACALVERPRVLISGVGHEGRGQPLRWLDWALDEIGVRGGDATARTEVRLWHGALQAALETETLLTHLGLAGAIAPLDTGPMEPLAASALAARGQEAREDRSRGFELLADAMTSGDMWWRLDTATGRADARVVFAGNGRKFHPRPGDGNTRAGIAQIGEAEQAALDRNPQEHFRKILRDLEHTKDKNKLARRAPQGPGHEYLALLQQQIPNTVSAGVLVAEAIVIALYYALWGG